MKLFKSSIINGLGFLLPALIVLPTMGYLSRVLGGELFGLFLLIFSLLGYASILDFGMTRALVLNFAKNNGEAYSDELTVGTGIIFVVFLSIIFGILLFYFAANIIDLMNLDELFKDDAVKSLRLMLFAIPLTLTSFCLLAIFEGKQMFEQLNILKVVAGFFLALTPFIFVFYEKSLYQAILGVVFARFFSLIFIFISCARIVNFKNIRWSFFELKRLLRFGGWITISNLISLMMSGADRFVLSNFVGTKSASFYIVASEMISRISIIPASISKTLFPYYASKKTTEESSSRIYFGIFFCILPVALPLYFFSDVLFFIWLGEGNVGNSSEIFNILLIGLFFNSLAQVPYSKLQANGNSRLTAIIHASELLPYFFLFYFMIVEFGVEGAAYAWTIRVVLDFILLEIFDKLKK